MSRLLLPALLAVLVAGPAATAPKLKDPPKPERRLVGTWVTDRLIGDGQDRSAANRHLTYTFTRDGRWVIPGDVAEDADRGYVLNPGGDATAIDLYVHLGKREGLLRGRYEVDGGTLTLCLASGGGRPAELRPDPGPVAPGRGVDYFVMRRVPDKE